MKQIFSISVVLFVFFIAMAGCKKDEKEIIDGTYKGTFKHFFKTGQTTLTLQDGSYSCTGNANKIPAGGSGT